MKRSKVLNQRLVTCQASNNGQSGVSFAGYPRCKKTYVAMAMLVFCALIYHKIYDRLTRHLRLDTTLVWTMIIAILGLFTQCATNPGKEQKPNILFIFTDDQAYWGVGHSGNGQLVTPTLDSLAMQGARFTNFFVPTPVCSPARASLMTSRYGSEVGITDWINHYWEGTLTGPEPGVGLDPAYTTWAEILQHSGYETALIGKWHLGIDPSFHPTNQGFDHFMGFLEGGVKVKDPKLNINGQDSIFSGPTTDILTRQALEYLSKRDGQGPFFLSLNYRAPHAPWLPLRNEDFDDYRHLKVEFPHPSYPHLDTTEVTRRTREYYGAIASVDRSVKSVLRKLHQLGLEENTIVIFTSDHGYNIGHNGIWHKGNGHWILTENPPARENIPEGQRPNLYDHSLKVPAIVKWPGVIKPNTVVPRTASLLDWYPTFLSMAGLPIPDSLVLRGRDLMPLLTEEQEQSWDNDLYAEYSTHHQSRTHMRMYRTPEWKLVMDFLNPGRHELYHLARDEEETQNLYGHPGLDSITIALENKILYQMKRIKDPLADSLRSQSISDQ